MGSFPPSPLACLGPSLGSDRPFSRPQEHRSPAAPTALGLLGPGMQEREGDRGQRLPARSRLPPAQEVVLCVPRSGAPALAFRLVPDAGRPCSSLPLLAWGESHSHFPAPRSSLCWARSTQPLTVLIFALGSCWNTGTFLKSSRWPLQAPPTSPIPAAPYPTLLDSTLFSQKAFGAWKFRPLSLGPKDLLSSSPFPFSPSQGALRCLRSLGWPVGATA